MPRLHIYDTRERTLVGLADRLLGAAAAVAGPFRRRERPARPARLLLLRLERIGDLLMTLPAFADLARELPGGEIDLVVGSWNAAIAPALPGISRVITLDAAWLAREGGGLGLPALAAASRAWRARPYDVAINFEPDIRSNLLLAMSGARWTAGYASGGGGALLDLALDYDTTQHTADNARRLVARTLGHAGELATATWPMLDLPDSAREEAARIVAGAGSPLVGIHASGGRAVKQWPADRFGDVARRLIADRGATIVLTGSAADRPLVAAIRQCLPAERVIDVAGALELPALGALVARLDLFVTGDTGPMHLAHAVGTPVVAIFGPSAPARYAPRGPLDRVVRIDLPCSPCNRIRLPPARCTGCTPDCLALLDAERVIAAADVVLDRLERERAGGVRP